MKICEYLIQSQNKCGSILGLTMRCKPAKVNCNNTAKMSTFLLEYFFYINGIVVMNITSNTVTCKENLRKMKQGDFMSPDATADQRFS